MAEFLTQRQILARRAEYLRTNMTKYEKKLWFEFLRGYEVVFKPQKVIGNYIVDFYCRKARLSIEIDGDSHYEEKAIGYDRTRTLFLEVREIKEIRFTNLEVLEDFSGVCEVIDGEVRKRRNDIDSSNYIKLKTREEDVSRETFSSSKLV